MNIYLVEQDVNNRYDTYDSFICYAKDESEARNMLPSEYAKWNDRYSGWCTSPEQVEVKYLGTVTAVNTNEETKVILASFNAG